MKRIGRILATCAMAAAAVCLAVGAVGCNHEEQTDAQGFTPSLDTETAAKITVAGNYSNFEALESAFERFNVYYPNVELTYVKLDDYNTAVITAVTGDNGPNIVTTFSWMKGNEKYDPLFANVENLADPSLGLDLDCLRTGIVGYADDGNLYQVPVFATTHGMLVNNDLFEKEGLSVPVTYDELVAVCDTLRQRGYASPVMGYNVKANNSFLYYMAYPYFCSTVVDNAAAIAALNSLDPSAGEYMRPALELVQRFLDDGCADLEACAAITDNYQEVIMRFFEGDVAMMVCNGDVVSGTQKREAQSDAFTANPFTYTFVPFPATSEGGYFLDTSSIQFSVNANCADLDMTNEFMRFLITDEELGNMAAIKRLVTPTKDLSLDKVYAPFGDVPASRVVVPDEAGILDATLSQFRAAAFAVSTGEMTVDEAVAHYGQF